jgi:hypothetical protein
LEAHVEEGAKYRHGCMLDQFGVQRSGAMLAWNYFRNRPAPKLAQHVQDTPEREDRWRSAFDQGEALDRKMQKNIAELIENTKCGIVIGAPRSPVVDLTYTMASEATGKLPENAPFTAAYFDHPGGHRVFSLRSRGDFGVGALAKQVDAALGFSGGGHKAASGFRAPLGWEGEGK